MTSSPPFSTHIAYSAKHKRSTVLKVTMANKMSGKANKYQELKDSLHKFLHGENPVANTMAMAEKYTKVDRKYIAMGEKASRPAPRLCDVFTFLLLLL